MCARHHRNDLNWWGELNKLFGLNEAKGRQMLEESHGELA
jgi:hypothetical protein